MGITAVLGAFWGDEGKGKVACYFSRDAHICARFQGGPNAGHTVRFDDKTLTFRMIPAGSLYAKQALIGTGMVLNPQMLIREYQWLTESLSKEVELKISMNAHIILPAHIELDTSDDTKRVGTTAMGVGPCYSQKARRRGVRVKELLHSAELMDQLGKEIVQRFRQLFSKCCTDTEEFIRYELSRKASIIAEGAQGALLDLDHGHYPFVTSSNTTIGAVLTGLGVGPKDIDSVIVVASAYMTKVGGGNFPSRMEKHLEKCIQENGNEIDGATGAIRQCGWFDVGALRWATQINQADAVVLTKLDVLAKIGRLYLYDGSEISRTLDGWDDDLSKIRAFDQLPAAVKNYISAIEESANVSVIGVSVGIEHENLLFREKIEVL